MCMRLQVLNLKICIVIFLSFKALPLPFLLSYYVNIPPPSLLQHLPLKMDMVMLIFVKNKNKCFLAFFQQTFKEPFLTQTLN